MFVFLFVKLQNFACCTWSSSLLFFESGWNSCNCVN